MLHALTPILVQAAAAQTGLSAGWQIALAVAELALLLVAILALVFSGVQAKGTAEQVKLLREQMERQEKRERSRRVLDFIARWNDPAFAESRSLALRFLRQNPRPGPEQIQAKFEEHDDFGVSLGLICGTLEEMAGAFNLQQVNREMFARFFAGVIMENYDLLGSWIQYHRERFDEDYRRLDKRVSSGLLEELEELHPVIDGWVQTGEFGDI